MQPRIGLKRREVAGDKGWAAERIVLHIILCANPKNPNPFAINGGRLAAAFIFGPCPLPPAKSYGPGSLSATKTAQALAHPHPDPPFSCL